MAVGQALWPEQLTLEETSLLDRGVPGELDRRPDVLVVGGGIVGVATALACQRAGLGSVVLIERERLGAGASGGAAGQLIPEAHVGVDPPPLVDLGRRSLALWRELQNSLPGGVGLIDLAWLGLRPSSSVFDTDMWLSAQRLDRHQVAALVPGLSQQSAGILVRDQARVNPLRAIARMCAHLSCVATGVTATGASVKDGLLHGVQTSAGDFAPRTVIFATGTPPRLAGLELELPAAEIKGHMLVTEPTSLRLPGSVAPLATTIDDGRLMMGGTLDVGDHERVVRPEVVDAMWADLEAVWPAARGIRITHRWACFRPAHADRLPVIDRVPSLGNAWLTSGHYKTGILMAPATGRAIADWISSGEQPDYVAPFAINR